MKPILPILLCLFCALSCQSQSEPTHEVHVGGPCEGCEAVFEYGDKQLLPVDTLPGFADINPKILIRGTIYQKDGKTPAGDVIMYIYHTNRNGVYETNGGESGWARRHGIHRGWIKTDADGKYMFYTFRPASYPNTSIPEHIHAIVKEAGKGPYFIADYMFEDDPLLSGTTKRNASTRGGSGIVKIDQSDRIGLIQRDIILGKDIPDYP